MAVNPLSGSTKYSFLSGPVLLTAIMYFLPAFSPPMFGWMNGLLAIPVFFLLTVNGLKLGAIQLRNSLIIACVGALLINRLEIFLFSLTLIPLGYSLYKSGVSRESESRAGGRGLLTLGLTWIIFWVIYGAIQEMHPYRQLLDILDMGFAQTAELYSQSTDISAETRFSLVQVIEDIRLLIPRILPGVLGCTVIFTVWINLAAGNNVLRKVSADRAPWQRYASWQLPDQLVWVPIAAAIAVLLASGSLQNLAIWIALCSCLVFFFQGLAVFIYLLEKWRVPLIFRFMLYFMLIIQSYGLVILAVLGIGDVWIDLRKQRSDSKEQDQP